LFTADPVSMRIGLDMMGGDYSPKATTKGAILALSELATDVKLTLIGNEGAVKRILANENVDENEFDFFHTTEIIEMGDHPTRAYAQKTNSSIATGFRLLKENKLDAFVSTGNTGAMLVGSMHTVRSVSGVIRPTITSVLPKPNGNVGIILDVGTNADCKPDVLYQFGILGSIYAEHIFNFINPKVGLLNIGEEEDKGNLLSRAAYEMMKDSSDFNFIGNVEGSDLFGDKVDVIVCDGFTGNVVLKEAEAFYALIKERNISDDYFDRFNYEFYGGTPVLGINSNVIIGHGMSSPKAIDKMIKLAKEVIEAKLSDKIRNAFE